MKRILMLLIPVAVVIAIFAQKWIQKSGPGQVVLFAPPDRGVTMTFDGVAHALQPRGFQRLEVKPGAHQVTVDGGAPRTVTVESGLSTVGVAADADACFDELDVALSHYGPSAGKVPPSVSLRYRFDKPFVLANTALSEAELPKQTSGPVQLLLAAPCRDDVKYLRHM
jgi:hypothetical protein